MPSDFFSQFEKNINIGPFDSFCGFGEHSQPSFSNLKNNKFNDGGNHFLQFYNHRICDDKQRKGRILVPLQRCDFFEAE